MTQITQMGMGQKAGTFWLVLMAQSLSQRIEVLRLEPDLLSALPNSLSALPDLLSAIADLLWGLPNSLPR
jgi:hypothetical protein